MSGPRWVRANLAWRQTEGGVVLPPTDSGDATGGFIDLDLHSSLTENGRIEELGAAVGPINHTCHVVDASRCAWVRVIVDVTEPLPAGAYASVQYISADNTDPAEEDWQFAGEGESGPYVAVDAVTVVPRRSARVNLALGARADITIRGVVAGGDGTTVLGLRKLQVQMDGMLAPGDEVPNPPPDPTVTEPCNRGGFRADSLPGVDPPPPGPPGPGPGGTGAVYFRADAESGLMVPPWESYNVQFNGTSSNSTTQARNGTRSYRYEVTSSGSPMESPTVAHAVQNLTFRPTASMGNPNGYYTSGYYSFGMYVDAGWNTDGGSSTGWNLLLGWMTGTPVNPISNIGLELHNGVLQLMYQLKNASGGGAYTAPTIAGYTMQSNGWYYMAAGSPQGIKAFPRNQWVHVCVYYVMAPTNGRVTIYQDGGLIMDLTAPTMNTFVGETTQQNASGGMLLQLGIYGGVQSGTQRMYIDDFLVTDTRVIA